MNTPNPLVPQGTFPDKGKAQVRMTVFAILAVHVVLLCVLLIAGCNKKTESDATNVTDPTTGLPPVPPAPPLPTLPPVPAPGPAVVGPVLPPAPVVAAVLDAVVASAGCAVSHSLHPPKAMAITATVDVDIMARVMSPPEARGRLPLTGSACRRSA